MLEHLIAWALRNRLVVGLAVAGIVFGGFLVARLHLHVFDRWFLKVGRVRAERDA